MKKRKSDKLWIPFWVDKWIFGSMRIECSTEERGVWWDIYALAAKDNGYIRANEETPYPLTQLSGMLIIPENTLSAAIDKFVELGKITRYENSVLYITNWEKYQFSDRHKRRVEAEMSDKKDIVADDEDTILDKSILNKSTLKNNKLNKEEKFVIPTWIPKTEFEEYKKMRQKIKKPMTDRAIELVIKKLEQLKTEGYEPKEVLEQSILNSWQGVFPLKDNRSEYKPSKIGKSTEKPTDDKEKYYEARRKKQLEIQAKYKKEIDAIRKKGDKIAGEALQEKIDEEVVEWSKGYKGEVKWKKKT